MRMDPIKMEKMSQKALERKCNKPIMEKKRRARINHCLNQLKSLILEADNERSRHSKLEKADILEMTVKYLQTLRAYHVHLNQINQLQQQQQQSQQHAQLQHHFQQQLTSNLKLVSPASTLAMANCHQQRLVAAATAVNNGNTNNGQSAPQSPIDLQMPVSLAQLPLPLQLSLQAAAASHQLPQSSPEASPKSTTSSSASSTASAASSPRLHSDGGSSTGLSSPTASQQHQQQQILQQAHQNSQHHRLHQQHLQLSQQHLSHLHHHHRHHHHLEQQISPTWRPW